jgi:hypothetical protein
MRNGKEYELGGEIIKDPPTTIIEKLAKGLCWVDKLAMDQAETAYKIALEKIDNLKSGQNGFQSINRYMGET